MSILKRRLMMNKAYVQTSVDPTLSCCKDKGERGGVGNRERKWKKGRHSSAFLITTMPR